MTAIAPTVVDGTLLREMHAVGTSIAATGLVVAGLRSDLAEASAFQRRLRHYVDTVDRDTVTVDQVLAAVAALLPTETPARSAAGAPGITSKENRS